MHYAKTLRQVSVAVLRIGIISDTHGVLRAQAVAFLRGCNHILHAGDIGSQSVLNELSMIAPLTAVRGNNDEGSWAQALPETELVPFGQVSVYLIHDIAHIDIDPKSKGVAVVVSGHSHRPLIEQLDGVFYVNPGSAGPRRFRLPIAVAELNISGNAITPRIVELAA